MVVGAVVTVTATRRALLSLSAADSSATGIVTAGRFILLFLLTERLCRPERLARLFSFSR